MNYQELALLLAVSVPVLTVAGYNLVLAFLGEEGTLLLPSLRPYPSIGVALRESPARTGRTGESANEEFRREAA